jgi:VRR-NUC domain
MIPTSWQKVSDGQARQARAAARSKATSERSVEKAIQQAFLLKHRIKLEKTDAGGSASQKGLRKLPKSLQDALQCPSGLPFGLSLWLHIPPGFPDLLGAITATRLLFIEVKKPGGRFQEGQKEFLEARRAEGHAAFWADSVDAALSKYQQWMQEAA